jgi:hypothetical protein
MRLGQHMTDEQRAKVSAKTSAAMSSETRAKLSDALKGRIPSDACFEASRKKCLGGHLCFEHKAKISAAEKGRQVSAETRANLAAAGIGRQVSAETRAKISAALWKCGIPVSRRKHTAKRRTLGFTPLNSWFSGCEGHHINKSDVIYLPRKLHRSISHNQWTGKGMTQINALAGQYLTEDWT